MSGESPLEFPCVFPIKIMGRYSPEFQQRAVSLVEKHTGKIADSAVQSAVSRNARFVSVTVVINASSQQQLDDIYRDLSAHEEVLMAL